MNTPGFERKPPDPMYLFTKKPRKTDRSRCARKNAKNKAKNRGRRNRVDSNR